MGHRGGNRDLPENSLENFKKGIESGHLDIIYLDVNLTKDLEVVVFHDSNLYNQTGKDVLLRDVNYKDLPPLIFNSHTYKIPRLDDIFTAFPSTPISINIESDNPKIVELIGNLIKNHDREKITIWGSHYHVSIHRNCGIQFPKLSRFFSDRSIRRILLAYWIGILPFIPLHCQVFETPISTGLFNLMIPNLFQHLNDRGIPVIIFDEGYQGLNSEGDWELVRSSGVNGICTSKMKELKSWFQAVVSRQ